MMALQCRNCIYWQKELFTEWIGVCNHPHKPDTGFMTTDAVYSCEMASLEIEEWGSHESEEEKDRTSVGALLL